MAIDFNRLADAAYQINASDIHLIEDGPVYMRVDGIMRPVQGATSARDDLARFLELYMPKRLNAWLEEHRGADFAWQPDERMRFRISAYYERDHLRIVMRLIKMKIKTADELGLPEVVREIASWHRGVALLTGVTGSGKTTTLAAMIQHMNSTEHRCIITIEDPIEIVHPNIKSVISQREVGRDIDTFRGGLVQALRQDPDVILIGEMRDPETISTALRASETGHYVFSTLHTGNATHTVERILAEFPEAEHGLIREQLASNLRATITQRLVRAAEGNGRVAALEIMVVNGMIQKLLREDQIASINTVIRERRDGMMLFDQCLADYVREKKITEAEAMQHVEDEAAFRRYIKGRVSSADRGGILM